MSLGKQFRVCTGVVLSFEMMQGYVLAMLHSDAQPDASSVLIACEATGFDDILPGGDAQSVVLGRLHVCMRVDAAVDVLSWLRKQARDERGACNRVSRRREPRDWRERHGRLRRAHDLQDDTRDRQKRSRR
ncbi:hypothetical protein [Xanthomonas arboricola]|uniref:hypothetical protein n=1 Tax=Xanthomonas arboricola TaxID=56448 RepID=UPI003EB72506